MDENKRDVRMRCPVCFSRETDIVLLRDNQELYCIKCGFRGQEGIIQDMYTDMQKKYRLINKRITIEKLRNKR